MRKLFTVMLIILTLLFTPCFASAAADPAVTVVNPVSGSTVFADNLLLSIKVTESRTIKVAVFEEKAVMSDGSLASLDSLEALSKVSAANLRHAVVLPTEVFYSNGSMSFYTKQLNAVTPGIYKIRVTTVDKAGKTLYMSDSYVVVRSPGSAAAVDLNSGQTGVFGFLQSFFKNVFGN